jgi:serine phosphatase RsbU (regulator of sigma subunit)
MLLSDSRISRIPLFAALPPMARATLVATLRETTYAAGTIICSEGDYGDRFYIILEGLIEIIKALGTDSERLLDVRGTGEFIGEMSLLNGDGLRTASARVRVAARVLELNRDEFDMLLRRHPSMAYEMLRVLSTSLSTSNDAAIRDLHEKNQRLTRAFADLRAAQAQVVEQETLMRELQLAREIQESMLPATLPQLDGFEIGARMLPARMVGGDFFDIIPLGPDSLGIAIGDVSGKGVPAALFMALASSLLRAEVTRGTLPEEALRLLNQHLLTRNAKGMFVTLLYGVLQRDTGEFRYVRAGHELPVGWDAEGRRINVTLGHGMPLGLIPDSALDVQSITLPPGGTLLLYTDGSVEAMDAQATLLGHDRLSEIARAAMGDSAQDLCDHLVQAIVDYQGAASQSDDITLVAVRAQPAELN